MKIIKYKKLDKSTYRVFIDDQYIDLSEEVILKYEILLLNEIDSKLLKKLKEENNFYEAYHMAIKYLSKKMRSIWEVKKYLASYEKEKVDDLINKLIDSGYLNDEYYVECYLKDRINLSKDGPIKIKKKLLELGIDPMIIDDKLKGFDLDIELQKIKEIAERKIKQNKNKSEYHLKQKIRDDLFNMGYISENISQVLDKLDFYNKDVYKKEKERIYKKLSKKYSDNELEYRYKNELYRLGFKE